MEKGILMLSFETYKSMLQLLLEKVREDFDKDLISFAVFGSVARGEAKPESDIDILIVHKRVNFNPLKKFIRILIELRESEVYRKLLGKGVYADPYPIFLTEKDLSQKPLILLDILDHGIILFDKNDWLKGKLNILRNKLNTLGAKRIGLEDGTWYWDLKPDWKPGEVVEIKI